MVRPLRPLRPISSNNAGNIVDALRRVYVHSASTVRPQRQNASSSKNKGLHFWWTQWTQWTHKNIFILTRGSVCREDCCRAVGGTAYKGNSSPSPGRAHSGGCAQACAHG